MFATSERIYFKYMTTNHLTARKIITFTCEGLRRYARANSLYMYIEHNHYRL